MCRNILWLSLVGLCVLILLVRFAQMGNAHLRHLFSLTTTQQSQSFWTQDRTSFWPNLKKHFLYAPLFKKRHNREIQLSNAINVGTLPSRFHTVLLLLYILSNVAYCSILEYHQKDRAALLAEVRGRTGVLAVVNMIPLFILAGRNNPLISMLRVSFDTHNLLHRWVGRVVVLESVAHTLAWAANEIDAAGWHGVNVALQSRAFEQYGLLATCAMVFLLGHSPSAIRHAFYETFLHLHQLMAFTAVLGIYVHFDLEKLPQLPYLKAIIALWLIERGIRLLRILYHNFSRNGWGQVTVEALPGGACRVTFDLQRRWKVSPGCHVYAYLPAVSLWMSHPFSLAWSEERLALPMNEKEETLPIAKSEADFSSPRNTTTSISLIMSKRTGMTAKLYEKASAAPRGIISMYGAVEGPYGGLESLHSYGTVILFAGGVGITHQVSHVRDLLAGYHDGTVAARKVVLVWSVRTTEQLEWVRPWMDQILAMPGRRELLKILLFVTKPRSAREVVSPSATVQMFPGRANPQVIIDKELNDRVGAMAVTVCGPGAFADSVRDAVRKRIHVGSIDFVEESFTW